MSGNAPEGRGVHLKAQAVSHLTLRVHFQAFLQGDFPVGIGDFGDHFLELEDLDFSGLILVTHFDVHAGPVFLLGRGADGVLDGPDEQFFVNAFVPAYLIDNPP